MMSKYDYKRIYNKIDELIDNSESFIDLSTEDNDIWLDDIEVLNQIRTLVEEYERNDVA